MKDEKLIREYTKVFEKESLDGKSMDILSRMKFIAKNNQSLRFRLDEIEEKLKSLSS